MFKKFRTLVQRTIQKAPTVAQIFSNRTIFYNIQKIPELHIERTLVKL